MSRDSFSFKEKKNLFTFGQYSESLQNHFTPHSIGKSPIYQFII